MLMRRITQRIKREVALMARRMERRGRFPARRIVLRDSHLNSPRSRQSRQLSDEDIVLTANTGRTHIPSGTGNFRVKTFGTTNVQSLEQPGLRDVDATQLGGFVNASRQRSPGGAYVAVEYG